MKKRSRAFAFLLALLMVVSLVPITVVTSSAAAVTPTYSTIPEEYASETDYPFAIFLDGEFRGAYKYWGNGESDGIDGVLEQAKQLAYMMPEDLEITIRVRSDYTMTSYDKFSDFTHIGNLTVDLNNKTFTMYENPMFQLSPGTTGMAMFSYTSTNFALEQHITIKNGNINTGDMPFINNGGGSSLDNITEEKNYHINVTDVNFTVPANSYKQPIYRDSASYSNKKTGINTFVEFNNCTYDVTAVNNKVTLFALSNTVTSLDATVIADNSFDPCYSNVTVRGGKFIADDLSQITFYSTNYGSDVFAFAKDGSGNFPTLEVPASYTVPADKWVVAREDGVDVSANFTGAETVNGEKKTVALKKAESVKGQAYQTPYGTIPAEYNDPDLYPFALFSGGSFKSAHKYLTGSATTGELSAFAAARTLSGDNGAKDTQILVRRNYTLRENSELLDDSYDNLAHFIGINTIDLAGNTLTLSNAADDNGCLVYAKSQTKGGAVPAVNRIFIFKNGTINTNGGAVVVCLTDIGFSTREENYRNQNYEINFDNVKFNMSNAEASLVKVQNTANYDNQLGTDFNINFRNCVIDASKHPGTVALFKLSDTTTRNRANVTVSGGTLIGDLNTLKLYDVDENDSFQFGRNSDRRFTDLSSTVAYDKAVPTVDGEMYYVATSTANVYELAYKTAYGVIPQEYDPFNYPFAVFAEGKFEGAYVAWSKDNHKSALWQARNLIGDQGKSSVDILLRRDYFALYSGSNIANANDPANYPYHNNTYANMAHFKAPLTIDLGNYSFTSNAGVPFLNLRAQAYNTSYKTNPTNVNITVKGGTIISYLNNAIVAYTQNHQTRDGSYETPQTFNVTFESTTFQIPYNGGREFIQIKDAGSNSKDKELGATFNFTFNDCTFDNTKRSSTSKYNPFVATSTENTANFLINGGQFTFSNAAGISDAIANLGTNTNNSLKFGEYNGAYTTMTVPTDNTNYDPSGKLYTGTNGEKLVFEQTSTTDTANIYTLGACSHDATATCQVKCTVCDEYAPHDFTGATTVYDDDNHWVECVVCPEGNKAKSNVTPHSYESDCDTTCDCGNVRTVEHNWKTTYETDGTHHWIICADCLLEKLDSKAEHTVGENGTEANCMGSNVCGTCGESFGEKKEDKHVGSVDGALHSDSDNHYYLCQCGKPIDITPHSVGIFGTLANCQSAKKCGTCGAFYGDPDTGVHTAYNVRNFDETNHWYECVCGAVDPSSVEAHDGTATCITLAHCSICGNDYGDYDANNHDQTNAYTNSNGNDTHTNYCSCDVPLSTEDCSVGENGTDETCSEPAICGVCNTAFGVPDATKHIPGNLDYNDTYHWYVCTECLEPIELIEHTGSYESDGEHHWKICSCDTEFAYGECYGGTNTCGSASVCADCNNPYGDYVDTNGHIPNNVWESDGTKHWQTCAVAGCGTKLLEENCDGFEPTCNKLGLCSTCENEYGELAPHTYDGTCDTECNYCGEKRTGTASHTYQNSCDKTCDVCREKRTITHTFKNACDDTCDVCFAKRTPAEHSGGTVSCTSGAICASCGEVYTEPAPHSYSNAWSYNSVSHWRECSCGAKSDEAKHELGEEINGSQFCVCGHTVEVLTKADDTSSDTVVIVSAVLGGVLGIGGIGIGLWFFLSKKGI